MNATTLLATGQTETLLLCDGEPVDLKAAAKDSPKRFEGVAYSGGIMRPQGLGPVVVDLTGVSLVAGSRPILRDHDDAQIVGHSESISVGRSEIAVSGVVSGTGEAATEVLSSSQNGFPWKLSIGARMLQTEHIAAGASVTCNGRTFQGPLRLVRKAELYEISFVSLPGDFDTSVKIAAKHNSSRKGQPMDFEQWLAAKGFANATDDQKEVLRAAYDAEHSADPVATMRDDALAETRRLTAIHQATADHPDIRATAIAENWDASKAELEVLKASLAPSPGFHIRHDRGRGGASGDVLEGAILAHMGHEDIGEKELGEHTMQRARDLRATSMMDIVRASLAAENNDRWHGSNDIIRAAFSTVSLPTTLGNAANKLALASYREAPATWRSFCDVRATKDFKTHTAVRLSATGQLEDVAPTGEIKHGSLDEATYTFNVGTVAKMLGLSRVDVVNDDLGLFDSTANAFGKMAARKVSDTVYSTLMGNSGSFFASGNNNAITTALGYSAIGEAITAMQTQRDAEGNDLDIRPATLVVSPELRDTATAALESEHLQRLADSTSTAVETHPTGNPSRQSVKLEVEPRLSNTDKFSTASATQWFLFAPPSDAPMIAAFLDGIQTPRIEFFGLDHDVNVLGVHWRVYMDIGAAFGDFRAAVRSTGAG